MSCRFAPCPQELCEWIAEFITELIRPYHGNLMPLLTNIGSRSVEADSGLYDAVCVMLPAIFICGAYGICLTFCMFYYFQYICIKIKIY